MHVNMIFISPQAIEVAIRQIKRWMIASIQDRNPLVAALHANYAVGNIDMLRQIATDYDIKKATREDVLELLREATKLQDRAVSRVKYQKRKGE